MKATLRWQMKATMFDPYKPENVHYISTYTFTQREAYADAAAFHKYFGNVRETTVTRVKVYE